MLANKPDAATHWHLGPGTASMFSAWLGILTPASEGDKNGEERAREEGGGGRPAHGLWVISLPWP